MQTKRVRSARLMMDRNRQHGNRKRLISVLWITNGLLVFALFFSLFKLIGILADYRESAARNARIAENVVQDAVQLPSASPEAEETPAPSELPITVDWAALRSVNPNAIAWLYSEGTPINYPVLQTYDNSYYLTRGADGEESAAGALFFDCRNAVQLPDANLIVYGHRMKDDSMFGSIVDYADKSYYAQHPVMYLLTETQSYRVEVFSCRTVRGDIKYFKTAFDGKAEYESYLRKAVSQSYWTTDTAVSADDSILTLVTCSQYSHTDDPRLLVHGRLVPVD